MTTGARVSADSTPELPDDPDLEVDRAPAGTPRPVHLQVPFLLLVFVGGVIGTAARAGLALAFPPVHGIPFSILAINLTGAFALGLLLEWLARRGPDEGRRRALRLFCGTGVIGGYTTYSALAADTAALIGGGSAWAGIGYAVVTVLVGGLATWAGIALGALVRRRGVRS